MRIELENEKKAKLNDFDNRFNGVLPEAGGADGPRKKGMSKHAKLTIRGKRTLNKKTKA